MTDDDHERYVPWFPIPNIPDRIYCDGIHDDFSGLRIVLRGSNGDGPALVLRFESAIGYRNVNETYRRLTLSRLDLSGGSRLRTVENSRWVKWLLMEAGPVIDVSRVVHYTILATEDCIDVATEFPPSAEWLGEPESKPESDGGKV